MPDHLYGNGATFAHEPQPKQAIKKPPRKDQGGMCKFIPVLN